MDQAPEDLRTRTKSFALRIIRLYASLPKQTDAQVLGKQLLRSGTSIGANYREAYRARSKAEFTAKVGDCLKEAEETMYWIELLIDSSIIPANQLAHLLDEANQLTAIFVSSLKKQKGQTQSRSRSNRKPKPE
ncbi:MAG TPA: four helix bundle protein [Roseiflexaceae bacterium]|nr:four helix bundle protein [Roseiflexaceae bacterium]